MQKEKAMAEKPKSDAPAGSRQVQVKVTDDVVGGTYSNHMVVAHTREEFFLDFFTMLPQMGKLASRVIVSPGHMKRILRALGENVARYEQSHGSILEAPAPTTGAPESVN